MTAEQETQNERLVRRAVNLFTFLGRTQQLLVKPVRTVDKFEAAMWFADLPDHEATDEAIVRASTKGHAAPAQMSAPDHPAQDQ